MTAHAHHRIHDHSREAYRAAQGAINPRAKLIVEWLRHNGPATDREIAKGLKFADMNSVRPRVSSLVEGGVLIEVSAKKCDVTGKTVRVVDLSLAERMNG